MRRLARFAAMGLAATTFSVPVAAQDFPTRPIRAIELFASMAGIQMLHVPYKGSGPALTELLGGQVSVMFDQLSSSMGFIKDELDKWRRVAKAANLQFN